MMIAKFEVKRCLLTRSRSPVGQQIDWCVTKHASGVLGVGYPALMQSAILKTNESFGAETRYEVRFTYLEML